MRAIGVLLGLVSLVLTPPPAGAAAAPTMTAGVEVGVKVVERAYGGGAVRQDRPGQRVRIRFRGQRGDQVRLHVRRAEPCTRTRLLRDGVALSPGRSGFTRLRRTGWHTFVFRPCAYPEGRHRLLLQKLRIRDLVADAGSMQVPQRRGHVEALRVEVPDDGLVVARRVGGRGRALDGFLPPTGALEVIGSEYPQGPDLGVPLFFRAGRPLEDVYGAAAGGSDESRAPLGPGDEVLLLPRGEATWRLDSPVTHLVALDGAEVDLATGSAPGRPQELAFTGDAGDWVELQDVDDETEQWVATAHTELLGPEELEVPATLRSLWRLPASGTYRLTLTPVRAETGTATVALGKVREIAPVTTDGVPRRFTTQAPGELVVAPVEITTPSDDDHYLLEATDVAMTGTWFIHVVPASGSLCGGRPPWPNGCGDFMSAVSSSYLESVWWAADAPYYAVLDPASGSEGQVDLRITPRP